MAQNLHNKLKFLLKKNKKQVQDITSSGDMNRAYFSDSINKNRYNQVFIEAIVKVLPDIDLNWFLKDEPVKEYNLENESLNVAEPATEYQTSKEIKIAELKKKILELFDELEK
jgi:hypothetical protein